MFQIFSGQPPSEIDVPKPVMVYLHGGGFLAGTGSSKMYSPGHLINYNVVFVSISYRLHVVGKA